MIRAANPCDVVVVGAGPAGSTAAQLLASWGWSVVLIHHGAARPSLVESLPPSTRKLLAFLGQLEPVERAGFYPNHGNVASWAHGQRVARTAASGFHVPRREFDRVLRDAASSARATIVDAIVRRVELGDPACVTYATAAGTVETCMAGQVLDCSGRAGILARRGFRRAETRYRTVAITAEWECPDWPADEHAQTVVESYADGWAWSVPLSRTRRQCTVMVEGRGSLLSTYRRSLASATAIQARLAGARPIGRPWACDASVYHAPHAADEGVLLVGDAASFIEPLSSAGVKKALLSAWRAAVVTNTGLKHSAMAGAARDLFAARERQVYAECMRGAAGFFREAAAAHGTRFWSVRAEQSDAVDSPTAADQWSDAALAGDADVRAAFSRLRASDRVRLRTAAHLRFEPMAAIEGREVVLRDALVVPGVDSPMQFAAGVDLPALARMARTGADGPALIAAYHAQIGPVPVSGLLTGLSLLVSRHALVTEGSPS